jgi:hypothetical protein
MKQVAETVVNLMATSTRTAPKAGGKDIYFGRKVPGK